MSKEVENYQQPKPTRSFKSEDSIKALDDKIKYYITEIITLKKIREEQLKTIAELRTENFKLKREVSQLTDRKS